MPIAPRARRGGWGPLRNVSPRQRPENPMFLPCCGSFARQRCRVTKRTPCRRASLPRQRGARVSFTDGLKLPQCFAGETLRRDRRRGRLSPRQRSMCERLRRDRPRGARTFGNVSHAQRCGRDRAGRSSTRPQTRVTTPGRGKLRCCRRIVRPATTRSGLENGGRPIVAGVTRTEGVLAPDRDAFTRSLLAQRARNGPPRPAPPKLQPRHVVSARARSRLLACTR